MRLPGWLHRLTQRRFLRNVAVVAGGTAAAQAITIAFSPFITRLYGPEAFGVLGVFVATVAMITPVLSLAYANAIVLPPSDDEARALVRVSVRVAVCVSLLTAIVFVFFHKPLAHAMGFDSAAPYLLLVPPVLLAIGVEGIARQWLIRKKQFRTLSGLTVAQSAALGTSKVGFGYFVATAPVLLVLKALGHLLYAGLLWGKAKGTLTESVTERADTPEVRPSASLREVALSYRDFPIFRAPQMLLNSVSQNIPTLILASMFGPASAGFFALGRGVLSLPASLISQSVGTVFLPRIAEAGHRGEPIRPLVVRGTLGLAAAGILPFGTVILAGPWLFGLVFGAEWVTAGLYARWLSVWLYFAFMNVPSVQAVPLLGLQGHLLAYEAATLPARAGALWLGAVILKSDVSTVMLFGVVGAVFNVGLIAWVIARSGGALRASIANREPALDGPEESEPLG